MEVREPRRLSVPCCGRQGDVCSLSGASVASMPPEEEVPTLAPAASSLPAAGDGSAASSLSL